MTNNPELQALASRTEASAPYGFEVFEQRRLAAALQRRTAAVGVVGAVAVLGMVSMLALVTQQPERFGESLPASQMPVATAVAVPDARALVNLSQFEITSELEDHIALLDDQLSAARVAALPRDRLRQIESTRARLNDSLQHISHAHSLMSL
jgi:hypothetical protein